MAQWNVVISTQTKFDGMLDDLRLITADTADEAKAAAGELCGIRSFVASVTPAAPAPDTQG